MTQHEKADLRARAWHWAELLNVDLKLVAVRPMARKWASCSTRGTVSLSTDVLRLEDDLVDYIIVHELLHLVVPNHGRLWKALMATHLGDYGSLDRRLRREVAQ